MKKKQQKKELFNMELKWGVEHLSISVLKSSLQHSKAIIQISPHLPHLYFIQWRWFLIAVSQPPSPFTTSSMVSGRVAEQVPPPLRSNCFSSQWPLGRMSCTLSLCTFTRHMALCKGTYAWRSCRGMGWDLGLAASSESTGTDYAWQINHWGTTVHNLRGSGG